MFDRHLATFNQDLSFSAQINARHAQIFTIRRRDLLLLRQRIFMFYIFVESWGPLYLTLVLQ